jgi:hypothetical protein
VAAQEGRADPQAADQEIVGQQDAFGAACSPVPHIDSGLARRPAFAPQIGDVLAVVGPPERRGVIAERLGASPAVRTVGHAEHFGRAVAIRVFGREPGLEAPGPQ